MNGYSPSTPNLEVIYHPCTANFMKSRTFISYGTKITLISKNILVFKKIIPPDEDNLVENCNGISIGHVTLIDQSESSKIITSHVTHEGKHKLTNMKLCNLA